MEIEIYIVIDSEGHVLSAFKTYEAADEACDRSLGWTIETCYLYSR